MTTEPFNLPRGSVRATIVLVLALGLIPVCIWGGSDALAGYTGIAGFVLRDYFHVRAEQNKQDGPQLAEPVSDDS